MTFKIEINGMVNIIHNMTTIYRNKSTTSDAHCSDPPGCSIIFIVQAIAMLAMAHQRPVAVTLHENFTKFN